MAEANYWTRLLAYRLSRRQALRRASFAAAGLGAALLVGCGDGGSAGSGSTEPRMGGTLKIASTVNFETLDPHVAGTTDAVSTNYAFGDPLIGRTPDLSLAPSLAEGWEIADPTTLVLKLRSGVKFHDATPFNAEAVRFNIQRVQAEATGAKPRADFLIIDRVEPVDELTARLVLKQPSASLLYILGDQGGIMLSPRASALGDKPVGTGPFVFGEWVKGSRVTGTRNPDYWGTDDAGRKLPYLDGFEVHLIPDQEIQFAGLERGEIHAMPVSGQYIQRTMGGASLQFVGGPTREFRTYYLNIAFPPIDNVDLRRAIAYGIDRQAVVDAIYFGFAEPAKSFISPNDWPYDPGIEGYSRDKQKVDEHLKRAGMPNGFTFTGIVSQDPNFQQISELVKAQLAEVGINYEYRVVDRATAIDRFYRGGKEGASIAGLAGRADIDQVVTLLFHSTGTNQIAHYVEGWRPDAEIDRLIEEGRSTYDQEERKEIYSRLQRRVLDLVYGQIPIVFPQSGYGLQQGVHGFQFYPDLKFSIREAWLAG